MSSLELAMRRRGTLLEVTAPAFLDDLQQIPEGREVMVKVWMARNPKQDAWYWATIGELVKSGIWDGDKESLHRYLKVALGLVEEMIGAPQKPSIDVTDAMITAGLSVIDVTEPAMRRALAVALAQVEAQPTVYYVLQSVSPSSMDKIEFGNFLRRVEEHVASRWGIDIRDLRKAVRARAGNVEPDWDTASSVPMTPDGTVAGEAAGVPSGASPALSADAKEILWALSAALGKARTGKEAYAIGEAFAKDHPFIVGSPFPPFTRAIYRLHAKRILEPALMPYAAFEKAVVDLIDNGVLPA